MTAEPPAASDREPAIARPHRRRDRVHGLPAAASNPPETGVVTNVLAIRSFRRLWIALTFSSLGDWLGFLATTSLGAALVHGGSSAKLYAVSGVLFVRLLPALLIGPFAGAWADRHNRRYTMVTADVLRFCLFVSIPLAQNLWWLLVASFLIECLSLFWIPSKEASVPTLVPPERLESANQLSLLTTYGTAAVASTLFALVSLINSGLAAAFPFFKSNPVDLALYFDALTFLFSAVTVFSLREISSARARDDADEMQSDGILTSIVEGWRFLGSLPWLKGLVIGILGAVVAGAAAIGLSKGFVADLRAGDAGYGVLFATIFVGLATGMFLGPRLLRGFSRRRLMGLSIVLAGGCLSVDALMPNLLLAIVLTFFVGAFAGVAWVVGITLVGLHVDDDKRGRTFSFLYNLMRLDLLVVVVAAPFLAALIGPHSLRLLHVRIRLDGVTLVLFAAGLLCAGIGLVSYRMMDDRSGIPLWQDVVSSLRRRPPVATSDRARGVFIAFEGGEGAGKSTQVALLADWLRGRGHQVVTTREPGATHVGAQLRALLLDQSNQRLAPRTEALLYAADRAQHVDEVIRPCLDAGGVVVSDRYVDSSLAYQGAGRSLPANDVAQLSTWATRGLTPDLTVVLDIDPAVGLHRRGGPGDRIEAEGGGFHERVRAHFLQLAQAEPRRYLVVDAAREPDVVAAEVRARVAALIDADAPSPSPSAAASPDDTAQLPVVDEPVRR